MKLKTLSLLLAAAYGTMTVGHAATAAGFEPSDKTYQQIFDTKDEKEIARASSYVRQNPDSDFTPKAGSLNLNVNDGKPLDFEGALDKVTLVRYPWFDVAYNEVMYRTPEKDSSTDKMDQQVSEKLTALTGDRKRLANQNQNLFAPYMGPLFAHSALGDLDQEYDLPGSQEFNNIRDMWEKSTSVKQVGPLGVLSPLETGESSIFKDRFGRLRPNRLNNKSFPSGHTYEGFKYASSMALLFPERTREIMSNALQYGESRVIVKAHWPTDTIASRTTNLYNFASLLADDEIRPAIIAEARQAHAKLAEACGDTARNCLDKQASPIADGYAADNDEIGYYGAHIDEPEAAQKTVSADELPELSANLLRLRFPYLTDEQRLDILAQTAYPADTLAGWMIEKGQPNTYWGVIDLPRATLGPVQIDRDMTVNQRTGLDDDVADFGKYDSWTNDTSGAGRLIKEGDGSLTLTGNNTFGGFDLNEGGLKLGGQNEFGGVSTAQNGTLTFQNGSLKGGLEANDGSLVTGHGSVDNLTLNSGSVLKTRGLNEEESKSPVTMHVTNDLTINPGSDYWVEVNPYGESTLLDVDGKTLINGGSVSASMVGTDTLLADADTPSVLGYKYKIIASKGGVTGEFDKINTQPLTLMQASLVYKPKEVDLSFKRNSNPMKAFAQNSNQADIAQNLDESQGVALYSAMPTVAFYSMSDAELNSTPAAQDLPQVQTFAAGDEPASSQSIVDKIAEIGREIDNTPLAKELSKPIEPLTPLDPSDYGPDAVINQRGTKISAQGGGNGSATINKTTTVNGKTVETVISSDPDKSTPARPQNVSVQETDLGNGVTQKVTTITDPELPGWSKTITTKTGPGVSETSVSENISSTGGPSKPAEQDNQPPVVAGNDNPPVDNQPKSPDVGLGSETADLEKEGKPGGSSFTPDGRSYEQIVNTRDESQIAPASEYYRYNPNIGFKRNDGSINYTFNDGKPLSFDDAMKKIDVVRYPWFDELYLNTVTRIPEKTSSAERADSEASAELGALTGPRKQLAEENINLKRDYMVGLFGHSALGNIDQKYNLGDSQGYKNLDKLWTASTKVISPMDDKEVFTSEILKKRFYRERPNKENNFSFPSGHTFAAFEYASVMSMIFPERTRELMSNGLQFGQSRVIVQAHWPTDTIASRTASYFNMANMLGDDELRGTIVNEAKQVRAEVAEACGGSVRDCLERQAEPIADGFAAENDQIGYYGKKLDPKDVVQTSVTADELPADAGNLLRLRFPYLDDAARRQILADTAYPADTLAGWMIEKGNPDTYWGVIDLPKATLGPVKIDKDLTVNQQSGLDDDIADFGKYDTWKSDISGAGQLIKQGDGKLTLAGNNSFGGFKLEGGDLALNGTNNFSKTSTAQNGRVILNNGTLNGGLTANQGAVVTGAGTVDNLTLNKGAQVRPQNQPGFTADRSTPAELNVSNNLVFNSGSDYRIELTGDGRSSHINVGGKVTINGGTVSAGMVGTDALLSDADTSSVVGNTYHILSAKGGVQGQFDGLNTQPLTLMTGTLNYQTNGIDLSFRRNEKPINDFAQGDNQSDLANQLDNSFGIPTAVYPAAAWGAYNGGYYGNGYYGYPQVNPVYENIVRSSRTPGQVTRALRQLSAAQSYADLASAQLQSSRYVHQAMRDRLSRSLIPTPEQQVANGQGSLWIKPVFSWAHMSGNDEAESFDNDTQGFMLGGDVGNEFDGRVGLLFGYTHSKLDSDLDSRIKSDNIHLGLYAGKTFENGLHLSGGLAHTWHRNDSERHTSFGRINEDNDVKFNARSFQAYGEVAYKLGWDMPFIAEPFANVAYVHYKNNGFDEDGIAGYDVESKSYNTTLTTLGLRGAWQADLGMDQKLTLSAEAGWQHNYGNRDYKADMAFKNTATKVGLQTVPLNRDSAVWSAGVGYQVKGANVSINYNGQVGGKYHDNTVSANLQWQF